MDFAVKLVEKLLHFNRYKNCFKYCDMTKYNTAKINNDFP